MAKYVLMTTDECGDEFRAYGSEFLSAEHEFPSFDENDDAMCDAFFAWQCSIEERANREWSEIFGEECSVHLEREFSDMSVADWARLGYEFDF